MEHLLIIAMLLIIMIMLVGYHQPAASQSNLELGPYIKSSTYGLTKQLVL